MTASPALTVAAVAGTFFLGGLAVGDVIESFNGIAVRNSRNLVDLKREVDIGERIALAIRRGNEKLRFVITAEERP